MSPLDPQRLAVIREDPAGAASRFTHPGLPRFDEMRPEHLAPAVRRLLAWSESELGRIERKVVPAWEGLLKPLADMDRPWDYVSGGGRHPMDVFRDFRGREPDTQALLRHSGLLTD